MKTIKLLFIFLFVSFGVFAQTTKEELFATPEKMGGVYYAYPSQDAGPHTPAPEGYSAFYVSHFGRHGSRYLIDEGDYKRVLDLFEKADTRNALSPLGKDVLERLRKVWEEADGRGGDLTPLGVRQHRGIAERMFNAYPEVFSGSDIELSARSSVVVRCVLSMDAFCERLKELNPKLNISRDASLRYMRYLTHHTAEGNAFRAANDTWREEYNKFEAAHVKPERITNTLFSDKDFILRAVNPGQLMWGLYWIAVDMQNMETPVSFMDLFEKEELFNLWQCINFRDYTQFGNYALNHGLIMQDAKPLLNNILVSAGEVIKAKGKGATLRFGHDGNIMPLVMLLHLDNCYNSISESSEFYKVWSNFKVAPMAGNVQIVFYRKLDSDDILVRFLLNEQEITVPPIESDVLPYYHWKDVESYYKSLLAN